MVYPLLTASHFQAEMRFPMDYPYSPPRLRFLSPLLHPNVYAVRDLSVFTSLPYLCPLPLSSSPLPLLPLILTQDGELCISILHPPGEDTLSGELPQERWNPTQSVRYIAVHMILNTWGHQLIRFCTYFMSNTTTVHKPVTTPTLGADPYLIKATFWCWSQTRFQCICCVDVWVRSHGRKE